MSEETAIRIAEALERVSDHTSMIAGMAILLVLIMFLILIIHK